jgi:hypothetical protein
VEYRYPAGTTSPIRHLLPALGEVFERVAPEHRANLRERTEDVTMEVLDSNKFECKAIAAFKLIVLSTRTIELTWAFSYAWWAFYHKEIAGTKADGQTVDLTGRDYLQPALRLLTWAVRERTKRADEHDHGVNRSWPEDQVSPTPPHAYASDEHVADEMTLVGAAFMMLHELAHTYLEPEADSAGVVSELAHERDCDAEAARWMLSSSELSVEERGKRALGIAVALLLITTRGIHTGDHDGRQHPFDFDRLIDILETYVEPDDDTVWGFVVGILSLHLTKVDIPPPQVELENFYDCALAYQQLLRERLESRPNT